jgi:hypothetical protein
VAADFEALVCVMKALIWPPADVQMTEARYGCFAKLTCFREVASGLAVDLSARTPAATTSTPGVSGATTPVVAASTPTTVGASPAASAVVTPTDSGVVVAGASAAASPAGTTARVDVKVEEGASAAAGATRTLSLVPMDPSNIPMELLRRRWPPIGDLKMYGTSQFLTAPVTMAPVSKSEISLYQRFLRSIEAERVR